MTIDRASAVDGRRNVPEGKWDAARADLVALYERHNEATGGTLRAHAEYLLTLVSVAAGG